jgi:tRNA dimethylallyltransferase
MLTRYNSTGSFLSDRLVPVKRNHLFDFRSPDQPGSAAEFIAQAKECIADIQQRGKLCILVGGTGMYLTALFHGLAAMPPRDESLRSELEALSPDERFLRLRAIDPESAQTLHVNDTLRVIRAIEVSEVQGVPYSRTLREHGQKEQHLYGLFLVPCWERDDLYDRINFRSTRMVEDGLIEETQGLLQRYGKSAPALQSLGYAQVLSYLERGGEREELIEEIARQTRRFAKRQMTFWRNEPAKRGWIRVPEQLPDQATVGSRSEKDGSRRERKGFAVMKPDFEELVERVEQRIREPFSSNEVWYLDACGFKDVGKADSR